MLVRVLTRPIINLTNFGNVSGNKSVQGQYSKSRRVCFSTRTFNLFTRIFASPTATVAGTCTSMKTTHLTLSTTPLADANSQYSFKVVIFKIT